MILALVAAMHSLPASVLARPVCRACRATSYSTGQLRNHYLVPAATPRSTEG